MEALYARTLTDFRRGTFRVIGDTVEVYPAYADYCYRITFFGDEVEEIEIFDADTGRKTETAEPSPSSPANLYIAPKEILPQIIHEIHEEMDEQVALFRKSRQIHGGQKTEGTGQL